MATNESAVSSGNAAARPEIFLQTVFHDLPQGARPWVAGFRADPYHPKAHWGGSAVNGRIPEFIEPEANCYLAVSSFGPGNDGRIYRRKENFAALHLVMVDDVGTKVPLAAITLDPSYLLETSPGNFQAGYLLSDPVTDRALAESVIDALVAQGLMTGGRDPGMKGVTRYGRLPVGINNKPALVAEHGQPFKVQMREWEPERRYTLAEIIAAYGLKLGKTRAEGDHAPYESYEPQADDPLLNWLAQRGLLQGPAKDSGWIPISCPWIDEHTDRADTGAAYLPGRGFQCHHGHCEHRTILDLRAWAKQQGWKEAARPAQAEAGATIDLDAYRGTDDANAALLLGMHGADIRYCPPWEKWLLWSGTHWRIDDALDIERRAADIPRLLYRRAAEALDSSERRKIADLARKLERTALRNTMLIAARHQVVIHHSDLDKGHFLLNCRNGTVDLTTGAMRPHERLDLLTHDVEIDYRPDAAAPTWRRFLDDVFAHDADLIQFVQRALGYSLTGNVREQVLLICHGSGSNGKSVFLNILRQLLGKLAWQAAPDLLLQDKARRHPTEQADLFGRRIIVCQETGEGRRFNETLVKQLTGGDAITARRMHEDFWSFEPTHKIWLSTNHRPEIKGTDYAIWRRMRLIPFTVQFSDESDPRKDPDMEARLLAELPGILAWAVQGCLDWQKHGLGMAEAVKAATASYQAESDVLAGWIADCCVVHRNAKARASALYRSYGEWCEQSGEHPEPQRRWGMRLPERGFHRYSNDGVWYRGIGLRAEGTEGTEPEKAYSPRENIQAQTYAVDGSDGSVSSVNPPDDDLSSQHQAVDPPTPDRNAPPSDAAGWKVWRAAQLEAEGWAPWNAKARAEQDWMDAAPVGEVVA